MWRKKQINESIRDIVEPCQARCDVMCESCLYGHSAQALPSEKYILESLKDLKNRRFLENECSRS
jgi:hypothetical protein